MYVWYSVCCCLVVVVCSLVMFLFSGVFCHSVCVCWLLVCLVVWFVRFCMLGGVLYVLCCVDVAFVCLYIISSFCWCIFCCLIVGVYYTVIFVCRDLVCLVVWFVWFCISGVFCMFCLFMFLFCLYVISLLFDASFVVLLLVCVTLSLFVGVLWLCVSVLFAFVVCGCYSCMCRFVLWCFDVVLFLFVCVFPWLRLLRHCLFVVLSLPCTILLFYVCVAFVVAVRF